MEHQSCPSRSRIGCLGGPVQVCDNLRGLCGCVLVGFGDAGALPHPIQRIAFLTVLHGPIVAVELTKWTLESSHRFEHCLVLCCLHAQELSMSLFPSPTL